MKVTIEKHPQCKATVRVEFSNEQVAEKRAKVLKDYIRQVKLPGFRPGKVPQAVVEKRFGDGIQAAAIQELAESGFGPAAEQEKLSVLSVDSVKSAEDAGDATAFVYEVTLNPEVNLPDYVGLKATVTRRSATDEDVLAELTKFQKSLATHKEVTDRASKADDFVLLDYVGTVEGKPLKGILPDNEAYMAENQGYLMQLTPESFLPGFAEQLEGTKAGDKRTVTITLPEEALDEIAGKEAIYEVTVQAVKEAELPELNDELAGRLAAGKTLADIKALLKTKLENDAKADEEQQRRVNVVVALREKADFDLPESAIQSATQRRANELFNANLRQGFDEDTLKEHSQEIISAASEQAAMDVKDEYLLLEVAKRENLTVTNDDLGRRITMIAMQNRMNPNKLVKQMKKNNELQPLRYHMLLEKAVTLLVEKAEIAYVD